MSQTQIDPSICPLCGHANRCAMASGDSAPCWCAQLDPRQPLATLLPADLPAQCICPACAQRLLQTQTDQKS